MRIHVTGGTGFLGLELLALAPEATGERVEIRNADAVRALFGRLRPDVVVHTAYRQDGEGAREIVVDGSANVARAAAAVGATSRPPLHRRRLRRPQGRAVRRG